LNYKLILRLSLFGLAMAFATVFWIPGNIEMIFWLFIFIICAITVAKRATEKYFWHGFVISIFNCVWITSAHIIFYDTYISHHAEEQEMMQQMSANANPKMMMLVVGPFFGVLFGLILGLFCFAASKMMRTK
jgi:hypothetical protein